MRTQDEIVDFLRSHVGGFTVEALIGYLDLAHAKEFLKPTAKAKAEEWKQDPIEGVLKELADYMAFAWGKVEDHRGISAGRSVQKCSAWAWLLGREDVYEYANNDDHYAQYGAPALKHICEAFGLPVPQDEGVQRMCEGLPCHDGCESGCG
jgi:hypothetical protein